MAGTYGVVGKLDVQELHRDLGRKHRNVGDKVDTIWRTFTPKQREKAMRGSVHDTPLLEHRRDPHPLGHREHIPEWNIREMTSSADHFLDMFMFRATTDLYDQIYEGPNDGPGDRKIVERSGPRFPRVLTQARTVFLTGDLYGQTLNPTAAAGGVWPSVPPGWESDFESVFIPATIGEMIVDRQTNVFLFLNQIVEEILNLGSETRHKQKSKKPANEALHKAVSSLSIQPQPLKPSLKDLMAQAMEVKAALEDHLHLLRSEPVMLDQAVIAEYLNRPELVPDDRGRVLPVMTDRHLSAAFFESVTTAIKTVATWDYICRLLRLLDAASDKIKRGLILQELTNTCHLEYRRAQQVFKRSVAPLSRVASKRFKRVTDISGHSKIVMRGQVSDSTVSDPQLHYILRLCHPETTPTAAVQWMQKLDDHNTRYPEDKGKLGDVETLALGDLAIIIGFMHVTSTTISMAPVSRKTGLLFTARAGELEAELKTIKLEADFGDYLVPMHNLLEPQVAPHALAALDDFIVERTGAKLGSLYEDIVQDSVNELERMCAEAHARLEQQIKKTTYVPLPAVEVAPASDARIAVRRTKEKTRPATSSPYTITAPVETPQTANIEVTKQIKVKAATALFFANMFAKSVARASVSWTAFESAMADLGFSVTPKGGSMLTYNPPESMGACPILLHRPHASELEGYKLLKVKRRLERAYGWTADTFVVD